MRCSHDPAWPSLSRGRRLLIAGTAFVAAIFLLREELSSAMVSRGDDMLYQGNAVRALAFYRRALIFDSANASAVDRYVFVSMTLHRRPALVSAVGVATRFLSMHPHNAMVRMDRALCELRLRLLIAAERDFVLVAAAKHDARVLVFAGYAAFESHAVQRAHALWRRALVVNPRYTPALRALGKR